MILGFITLNNVTEAVIHCAEKPLNWSDVENNFFVRTRLGSRVEVSIVSVPISSLVHPLCALPDCGSDNYHTLSYYQNEIGVVTLVIKSNSEITYIN